MAEFKDVFSLVDKDADGSVTSAELRGMMRKTLADSHDVSAEEFEAMVNEFDVDKSGTLVLPAFQDVMGLMAGAGMTLEEENNAIFSRMAGFEDSPGLGGGDLITPEDLRKLFAALGENVSNGELDGIVAQCMKDNPAAEGITREAFLAFLQE